MLFIVIHIKLGEAFIEIQKKQIKKKEGKENEIECYMEKERDCVCVCLSVCV